jgi:hypothetical protein
MRTIPCAVVVSFTITSSTIAFADVEAPEPDKSSHWLFEPTPTDQMRALAPGDTPYTVDAGHVQLEVDALDTAWVREGDTHGRETSFGFTAKVGLLPRVDLHVHYSPYNHVRTSGADGMSSIAGAGLRHLAPLITRGRSDRGSSPCSMPPRSPARTAAASRWTHRPRRELGAESSNRRRGRRRCPST